MRGRTSFFEACSRCLGDRNNELQTTVRSAGSRRKGMERPSPQVQALMRIVAGECHRGESRKLGAGGRIPASLEAAAGQGLKRSSCLVEVDGEARGPPELERGAHVTIVAGNE